MPKRSRTLVIIVDHVGGVQYAESLTSFSLIILLSCLEVSVVNVKAKVSVGSGCHVTSTFSFANDEYILGLL